MRKVVGTCLVLSLMALAAWQLGQAGLLAAKAWAAPILIKHAWAETERSGVVQRPWPWADSGPAARLHIPRLDVKRYVLAGDNMRNLAFGPVLQQQHDQTILFGHRDTHFRFLKDLETADLLIFEAMGQEPQQWEVVDQQIVSADNLYIPTGSDQRGLMLVTCYPFGALDPDTNDRYVVWLQAA